MDGIWVWQWKDFLFTFCWNLEQVFLGGGMWNLIMQKLFSVGFWLVGLEGSVRFVFFWEGWSLLEKFWNPMGWTAYSMMDGWKVDEFMSWLIFLERCYISKPMFFIFFWKQVVKIIQIYFESTMRHIFLETLLIFWENGMLKKKLL